MEYIAFDAHKHYTLASVARPDGRLVREQRLPHERGALQQFLARCEPGSPVAVETWATPTLHRRSTNDQALRLRPRPDPTRQHQLLDVDHGNVVRTAHRNERRLAVPAEPNWSRPGRSSGASLL